MKRKWSSNFTDNYVRCPVPNCNHAGDIITKIHFRMHHNLERDEAGRIYGGAIQVKYKNPLNSVSNKENKIKKNYVIGRMWLKNVQFI